MTALTSIDIIRGVTASMKTESMPSLSARKFDEQSLSQLRIEAAKHGLSLDEEVRQIIKSAVSTPENSGDLAVRSFCPANQGEELTLGERKVHEPLGFGS